MDFHIFIATSKEYEVFNLERIILNIESTNIPKDIIHIISGGHESESFESVRGVELIRVPYRCFEFTPFIYLVKHQEKYNFEYAFFTHDTVEFGKNFYNIMKGIVLNMKNNKYDSRKIDSGMSMNIGLYSKDIILKSENRLLNLCLYTNDSNALWDMKQKLVYHEDFIFKTGTVSPEHSNPHRIVMKTTDNSGKEIDLGKKIYSDIDFIKYQSNYNGIFSIYPTRLDIF